MLVWDVTTAGVVVYGCDDVDGADVDAVVITVVDNVVVAVDATVASVVVVAVSTAVDTIVVAK